MGAAFSEFLHGLRFADLSEDVKRHARRSILDLIGVGAAGAETKLSSVIRAHAAAQFGAGSGGGARMIFDGRAVSPAGAALAGGMTIDAMDGHDGHKLTKGHVGCALLPAILAIMEAEGQLSRAGADEDLLTAVVLGYEIGTRCGIALHATAPDYHTSGAWMAVAAAAVGARLLGLDPARAREAIGVAEYHGPRSQMMRCIDHPTMLKDGSGWGAMAGVSAAYLARDGFTGAPAITVEGADAAEVWADLGERWRIAEQYFKPAPVCRWAQPPMIAAHNLMTENGLSSAQIEHVEVVTFHESLRLAVRSPRTTEEAQYSTAYPTAAIIARGEVGAAEVSEAAFADPEIRRLAQGMTIRESEAYNAEFPARRLAHVVLSLRDGRRLTSPTTEPRGDAEAPLSDAELLEKFHRLSSPLLTRERSERVAKHALGLGDGVDCAALLEEIMTPQNAAALNAAQ